MVTDVPGFKCFVISRGCLGPQDSNSHVQLASWPVAPTKGGCAAPFPPLHGSFAIPALASIAHHRLLHWSRSELTEEDGSEKGFPTFSRVSLSPVSASPMQVGCRP